MAKCGTRVREATVGDVPAVFRLMTELAVFENLSAAIETDEARLREHGFGPDPRFRILVAEHEGKVAGFLSYMVRYSIWGGGHFINLDDLFVSEAARGRGLGRALMRRLAAIAAQEKKTVRWELLPDNHPARAFYLSLGATITEKLIARWSIPVAPSEEF